MATYEQILQEEERRRGPRRNQPAPAYSSLNSITQDGGTPLVSNVSTVSSDGGPTQVLRVGGQLTRASNRPTLEEYLGNYDRYVSSAGDLRSRYLGGEEGQELRAGRSFDRFLTDFALDNGIDDPNLSDAAKGLAPLAIKAAQETGVPASILLAVAGQESAYGTNDNTSSAGAQSATQFIPSTRKYMIDEYGVDPWASDQDALRAAGYYLKELGVNENPSAALSSYSGGYAEGDYNNPILTRAAGFAKLDKFTGQAGGNTSLASNTTKDGRRQLSVAELFYDPGTSLKDNAPTAAIGGHSDHVHFASENQRDLLKAAALAQRLGLDVRENPLFDPVDPVHTGGSYHYETQELKPSLVDRARELGGTGDEIGEALDISGDPAAMARLDQRIVKLAGAPLGATGTSYVSGGTGAPTLGSPIGSGTGASIMGSLSSGGGRPTPAPSPISIGDNPLASRAALPAPYLDRTAGDDELADEDVYAALYKPKRRLQTR